MIIEYVMMSTSLVSKSREILPNFKKKSRSPTPTLKNYAFFNAFLIEKLCILKQG